MRWAQLNTDIWAANIKQEKQRGFTIVELLIVIVVIAILAAISVVAYTGIQNRARNAQVVSGVNAYVKALRLYQVDNGALPSESGCLGSGYPGNTCWTYQGQPSHTVSAALDSQLAQYLGSKPTLATSLFPIGISSYERAGATYRAGERMIFYYLQGLSQACDAGGSGVNEGGLVTQCRVNL